jgi:hypothetical protein
MVSEILLAALIAVESGGDVNAIGDRGKAVGILQIHIEVVKDCNTILKEKRFKYVDRKDRINSKIMCSVYLGHYCSEARLGRKATFKDYALCWHYGPMGPWMKDKDGYWDKVIPELIKRIDKTNLAEVTQCN